MTARLGHVRLDLLQTTLRVEGLSKNFGGLQVLDRLSFSVMPGERRAIIGPNGAGKTTLFNLITGELPPSRGRIFLSGEDITSLPNYERARRGLGRTFQKNNLFLNLTILDNLILVLQKKNHHCRNWHQRLDHRSFPHLYVETEQLLETWGLAERKHHLIKELSYGEQRQVEILLALASSPSLLLLDEPTAGMSVAETQRIFELLAQLPTTITILIIEHDMDLVFGLADRITVLYYGKVLAEGTPEEIRSNPNVQEVYLGQSVEAGVI